MHTDSVSYLGTEGVCFDYLCSVFYVQTGVTLRAIKRLCVQFNFLIETFITE
jgi:hypothetical protein